MATSLEKWIRLYIAQEMAIPRKGKGLLLLFVLKVEPPISIGKYYYASLQQDFYLVKFHGHGNPFPQKGNAVNKVLEKTLPAADDM